MPHEKKPFDKQDENNYLLHQLSHISRFLAESVGPLM